MSQEVFQPAPPAEQPPTTPEELLTLRNQWLQSQIDPHNTLPSVSLDGRFGPRGEYKIFENEQGEQIGYTALRLPYGEAEYGNSAFIEHIKIHRDYSNKEVKGYGMSTYLEIMKSLPLGVHLETATNLSVHSLKVWKSLVEKGVAVASHAPEEEILDTDYQYPLTMKFRTIVPYNEIPVRPAVNVEKLEETSKEGKGQRIGRLLSRFRSHH